MRAFLIALILLIGTSNHSLADQLCGLGENDCQIELGEYNIELPKRINATVKIPAFGSGWSFHPDRKKRRDELTFAKAVLEDATNKFNLDRDRILMTGFSIGGSLTWYLACQDPNVVKAFAPVAGAFWRPHPSAQDCAGPVKLLHTHGWVDGTVPLEGRPIGPVDNPRIVQGDVFYGLQLMRQVNGCKGLKADKFDTSGKFWKRWWTKCAPNSALQFNLFQGGHSVPKGWASEAINWFEALESNEG